jgi:excisionase family DNA binding protein
MTTIDVARLWTKAEVADFPRLSTRTIDRRVRDGSLPAIKLGGSIRFSPSAVIEATTADDGW